MSHDKNGNHLIVMSDEADTQIFRYDDKEMKVSKLTKVICHNNSIKSLPPLSWVQMFENPSTKAISIIGVESSLNVVSINLENNKLTQLGSLSQQLKVSLQTKLRKYDNLLSFAQFNPENNMLTTNLASHGVCLFTINLNKEDGLNLFWKLPHPGNASSQALCVTTCPQLEKMVVAYDSNLLLAYDLNNKCLHDWSRRNHDSFPHNFLTRYNRLVGLVSLSDTKFLAYSNYTYTILDLNTDLPKYEDSKVQITDDHPGKQLDTNASWNQAMKIGQ